MNKRKKKKIQIDKSTFNKNNLTVPIRVTNADVYYNAAFDKIICFNICFFKFSKFFNKFLTGHLAAISKCNKLSEKILVIVGV